jgi:hypothetical protein
MNEWKVFTDERGGNLIPVEFKNIRFQPKRVFTVSNVPVGAVRGNHAHYETEQLLICINGQILVGLDDGKALKEIILNPGQSVYVDKMVWDYQKFITGNEFMLVLSSTNYDPKDYINNIDEFYSKVKNG